VARIKSRQSQPPTEINKFLGLNENETGDTQLELGESPNMTNFRVTDDYKLKTREGYAELFASLGAYSIRGMWYGKISGAYHFLFAANGKVYEHDLSAGTNTELGTLTDAETFFFSFDDKVYMLNGNEYKYWDGTTFGDVAGYRPTVYIAAPPSGGGTAYEQANLLTGAKRMTFSGDGSSTVYQLPETDIDSVDAVEVNGTAQTEGTDYTVDLAAGTVTFSTAPDDSAPENVVIDWTKTNATDRPQITKCRAAMLFGGANDTRIHLWGNSDYKNRRFYSGIPVDGSTSAEYFPINANADIGSYEFAITDIIRQYDRQIILKERASYYSYYELDTNGNASFPVYPLNGNIGNVAFAQGRLVQNNPYSVFKGVYEWISTTVRDERNAVYISKKVQPSLDDVDLTTAKTIDWEEKGEYWLAVGNTIWIYNYRNGTWYKFELTDTPTCFIVINSEMHFGTTNGQIMKFDADLRNDNGADMTYRWEMNLYDFQTKWLQKFLNRIWISMQPGSKEKVTVKWQTDRDTSTQTYDIQYSLMDYSKIDYSNWSYLTYYNPQPFRLKIKAKKFVYFKLILENTTNTEKATILSISLLTRTGGEAK